MFSFFFFNDTATTEIYTLSLHDALPIWLSGQSFIPERTLWAYREDVNRWETRAPLPVPRGASGGARDRKSTRLNSSHSQISYAVFCLKKKNFLPLVPAHQTDQRPRQPRP